MQRLRATIKDHYPYLLRRDVSAEVTITFKVVRGTIQEEFVRGDCAALSPGGGVVVVLKTWEPTYRRKASASWVRRSFWEACRWMRLTFPP